MPVLGQTLPVHVRYTSCLVGNNVLFVPASRRASGGAKTAQICPVCQGPVVPLNGPGQPRRYCSSRCKSRAARKRREIGAVSSLRPESARLDELEATKASRRTRPATRDAAIAMVTSDPMAMLQCLWFVAPRVSSPHVRESGWSMVADQIRRLAHEIDDDDF